MIIYIGKVFWKNHLQFGSIITQPLLALATLAKTTQDTYLSQIPQGIQGK